MTIFAENYERDDNNRIIFPRDTELRRQLFPWTDPSEHVAKANMLMVKELVEHFTNEGETILDPFAGTGTIMVACTINRKVIMIELEETFSDTIELNVIGLRNGKMYDMPDISDLITTIPETDAHAILPLPDFCDHLIFSPPYPMGLKKKGEMDQTSKDLGMGHAAEYSTSMNNFTNLNPFIYHQKIEQFYKKCLDTVKVGGTMTVIIKDHMEKGKRLMQADRTERDLLRMGWELVERNKWLAKGGGYSAINRAAGLETVDEEDLITVRKV